VTTNEDHWTRGTSRLQSAGRRQEQSVARPKRWSAHLTTENGQFVAKHHNFKIFRSSRSKQKDEQLQQALKDYVKG
jgi:hypothetical protein